MLFRSATGLTIAGVHYATSVAAHAGLAESFAVANVDALTLRDVASLAKYGADIVLLGTGAALRFPPNAIRAEFARLGMGLEVMDVNAAARTFNVLLQEHRNVLLVALIG